jgi:transposase
MEERRTISAALFGEEELAKMTKEQESAGSTTTEKAKPRFKPVNRQQLLMRTVDVERLVEADHPVRAIWEMMGQVDLSGFEEKIRSVEGRAGQATLQPRVLASLWVYAYSEGVSSARELSRMSEDDAACQWLTGMQSVNHHTLSDFRTSDKGVLDGIFTQVLGLLSAEDLIELKQVTQDGTKVKANAGKDTFRRAQRLKEHLELAERQIQELGDPQSESIGRRVAKAKERALKEKTRRLELALEQLEALQQSKANEDPSQLRVSTTDPEARKMKNGDGGYMPAYNVQICTDVAHGIIVDIEPVQAGNDLHQLQPAVERVEQNIGKVPLVIADAGYISRDNIEAMADRSVELIGPVPATVSEPQRYAKRGIGEDFHSEAFRFDPMANHYVCPNGKILRLATKERHRGRIKLKYQAKPSDCAACPFRQQCCPKTRSRRITRSGDSGKVKAFISKMETSEAKKIYARRGSVAEFVNAWIKEKLGLRQFRLRGLAKVKTECLWVALTYNIQQWVRLRWRVQSAVA